MAQEISVRGFILKTQELGEADLLLTFFSSEQGKLRVSVKSAKRLTSKLAGHLQPTALVELTLAGNGGLPKVIGAQLLSNYSGILQTEAAMAALQAMQELTNRALPDGQLNNQLFELFEQTLSRLGQEESPLLLLTNFYKESLNSFGLAPRPMAHPGSQIFFSKQEGRFIAVPESSDDAPVSSAAYELYLRGLKEGDDQAASQELLKLLHHFAVYQLERPLYSAQYFFSDLT